jgi:nucleoside-diphosphate-sugar epimerase
VSIGETARLIAEVMGAEIEIVEDSRRIRPEKSEVERLFASIDKMRHLTQWVPAYGNLDGFRRGLAETVAWFSAPGNLGSYKSHVYNI